MEHPLSLAAERQTSGVTGGEEGEGAVSPGVLQAYRRGTARRAMSVNTMRNVAQMFVELYLISPATGTGNSLTNIVRLTSTKVGSMKKFAE